MCIIIFFAPKPETTEPKSEHPTCETKPRKQEPQIATQGNKNDILGQHRSKTMLQVVFITKQK
jgi:hypothetical protein